jgi:hypothetical protein
LLAFYTAIALLVLFAGQSLAFGQFTNASLTGIVTDSSGSVVPAAKVSIQSVETGLTRVVTAGADGSYLFPALPIGAYRLKVEKDGFSTYVQDGITLAVSQVATQAVTLHPGNVSQQINVSADAEMLPTETSTVSQSSALSPFNAFNNVNFSNPGNTVGGGNFGEITSAGSPRIIQFALKLSF